MALCVWYTDIERKMHMNIDILLNILRPDMLLLVFLGTLFGTVMGAIPGLTGSIGIALLIPLTYTMQPDAALLMMGGIFMGGMYGGSITAILLNVPGDVCAACTAIEGHPMAQKGRAKEALYYSIFSSMFGGLLGILVLIFLTPPLARIALKFGPPEMFFLALCGMSVVGSLTGNNIFKGLFAAAFGILLSTVGSDPMTGYPRFTFGSVGAQAGISVIPLCIGMFCFSEMLMNIGKKLSGNVYYVEQKITRLEVIKNILRKWVLLLKSSIIGILIGILPGIGASLAVFISYGEAKRNSKHPETYGKGNPEGIIAAEAANNALVGGSLVPLLALGIPGCATAAIMGGALAIHGIIAGPELFTKRPDVAYTFLYGMPFSVIAMALIGAFCVKYFSFILKVKMQYIVPIVFAFSMFGAYCVKSSLFEVRMAIILGILAVVFKLLGIPVAPVVVGLVLGPLIELNLRRSLILAEANGTSFITYVITRPVCIVIIIILALCIYLFGKQGRKGLKIREEEG
jgi:putative tricarboxylic transport membrane protein